MKSIVSMIASLLTIACILIGGPFLLVMVGRLDLLFSINWSALFRVPDDGSLVLLILTVVGWVAWVLVASSLISEAIAIITSGRVQINVPGTRWFKPAAAALMAASIGLIIGALSPSTDQPVGAASTTPPEPMASATATMRTAPDENEAPIVAPSSTSSYIVQPGDDLWSLAEKFLGMGERWREIAEVNTTSLLQVTDELVPGSVLHLPEAAAVEPSAEAQAAETVTVEAGDSLWVLAEEHLDDGHRWPEIFESNRDVIADPDVIDVGWVLDMPAMPGQASEAAFNENNTSTDVATPALGEASPADAAELGVDEPTGAAADDLTEASSSVTDAASTADVSPDAEAASGGETFNGDQQSQFVAAAPVGTSVSGSIVEMPATSSVQKPQFDFDLDAELARRIGAIGGGLALALTAGLRWRRRRQLVERGLGRSIMVPQGELADVEQALQIRGASATRKILPLGSVTVGWRDDGSPVVIDLEEPVVTKVSGEADDVSAALAAIASELLAADTHVIAVGSSLTWLETYEHAQLSSTAERSEGLNQLASAVSQRLSALVNGQTARDLRADDEVAYAWQPIVAVVDGPLDLSPSLIAQMKRVGVSAVCADDSAALTSGSAGQVITLDDEVATLAPQGDSFTAQLISPPARRALVELFEVTGSTMTTPAPWWAHDAATVAGVASMGFQISREESLVAEITNAHHPRLFMLGPVTIEGARGQLPPRALKQCAEYCGYLLANPGATATAMSRDLCVAESTRRSNMSRLRTWLGNDAEGKPYLPDAYTGHIYLHPGVSSDWEHFLTLISGGVNRASTTNLRDALSLVRGAPLADAAPGQWHWAEELRTNMASAIRDVGVVLGERYLEDGDVDGARWAASRALRAAPEDERLMAVRIKTEHRVGNTFELERLVLHLTRHARMVGVDLRPETVTLLQEVMEGTVRARNV